MEPWNPTIYRTGTSQAWYNITDDYYDLIKQINHSNFESLKFCFIYKNFGHPTLQTSLEHNHAYPYIHTSLRICTYYYDVIMGAMASQITSLANIYSTVYTGADQRKYQSSASLAFVRGIHRWPVNSPHKWPVTRKMFPFHDVIMFGIVEIRDYWNKGSPYISFQISEMITRLLRSFPEFHSDAVMLIHHSISI